jgi:carbamoyltransferase
LNVLGISCFYHDAAAALVVDGALVAASEEERFSRVKHDFEFPQRAIDFCLRTAGITAHDLDLVVFYEKPFWKLDRILMSALQTFPRSLGAFREGMLVWLLDKLWVRDVIAERLGIPRKKVAFSQHHLSHACSSFYCSGFDRAAVLTVDGVGEWATGTRGVAYDDTIELQDRMSYPHSIGLLYSAFTAFLGFQVNEGEYKVMGLAPYGEPRFVDRIFEKLVDLHDDGSFWLDMSYFAYHHSAYYSFNERFAALFGRPRSPQESNTLDPHYADIAASIQKATEEILVRQAQVLAKRTGHENLAMSGGVALNSVANARILRDSGFKRLFIQPAAGDGGGALGAALYGAYVVLGEKNRFRMTHAYWGEAHTDEAIAAWLKASGHEYRELGDEDAVCDEVAERLENGQVVGWMQGRFEWGPRALGHRSILADPRTAIMKDIVNARIKFREPFRPFAPSVLAERVEDFFTLPDAMEVDPARYMLLVLPVHEDRKEQLQAITHVDGTARIQAVHEAESPRYHKVIRRFGERTGVPVVLNTSFNLRGEPIVNTPAEAFSTFARSDMDALVMGRFVVSRRAVGEGRRTSGAELEEWRHAPKMAPLQPEIPDERDRVRLGGGGHNLFGVAAPAEDHGGRVKAAIGKALLSIVGVLVVLEIFLRFYLPIPNLQLGGMYRQQGELVDLTPGWHRTVHGSEFKVPLAIDEKGLRDSRLPDPGKPHLLVLGDSFTFGCWSTEDRRFTGVLGTALGGAVQVISGGNPNYGTGAELMLLRQRFDEWKPKAVVLAFYDGNDYWDNFVGPTAYRVNRGYLEMREPWWSREMSYNCLAGGGEEPTVGAWAPARDPLPSPWALSASAPPPAESAVWPFDWLGSTLRHTEVYQVGAAIHLTVTTPERFLRPIDAEAWMLRKYTPEMTQAVEMTYRYLDGIQAECQRRGVPLLLMVIPASHGVIDDEAWTKWLADQHLEAGLFDRDKPTALAINWARARNVPALDLSPYLRNRPDLYYRHDMHWTDRGHFQAGEHLAEFLQARGIAR